jgi:hypothetical protein
MSRRNERGGINPGSPEELKRAEAADLITFPVDVHGARCTNCAYYRKVREPNYGYCFHPKVSQEVNERMCCSFWDAPGTVRPWEK